MLTIEELSFWYGDHQIFNQLSYQQMSGEIATLVGKSGSGKTTLLKILTGMISKKNNPEIKLEAKQLEPEPQKIAYMTQEDALLPWRSVLENTMLLGELGNENRDKTALVREAQAMLQEVGLEGCENLYPEQLSGGMCQRVALAQVLLLNRPVLLLDEPFSALDYPLREQMYALLKELNLKHPKTILLITHDFRDALQFSDRLMVLSNGKLTSDWDLKSVRDQGFLRKSDILKEIHDSLKDQRLNIRGKQ